MDSNQDRLINDLERCIELLQGHVYRLKGTESEVYKGVKRRSSQDRQGSKRRKLAHNDTHGTPNLFQQERGTLEGQQTGFKREREESPDQGTQGDKRIKVAQPRGNTQDGHCRLSLPLWSRKPRQ